MEVSFQLVTIQDGKDFELIAKWDNDEQIKYLIRPNFNEGEIKDAESSELFENFKRSNGKYLFLILVDNEKVGYISLDPYFPMLFNEMERTGWLSICVGESQCRGLGIGKAAMGFIESKAKELNLQRLELGVFEYNYSAIEFYKRLGYQEIGHVVNFSYYQDKWHDDIRMEKWL